MTGRKISKLDWRTQRWEGSPGALRIGRGVASLRILRSLSGVETEDLASERVDGTGNQV